MYASRNGIFNHLMVPDYFNWDKVVFYIVCNETQKLWFQRCMRGHEQKPQCN